MAEVKFVNIAKYKGIRYPAHTSFKVDDQDLPGLIDKGAIVTVPPKEDESSGKSIDEMKADELKAYAAQHEIDITGIEKKSDILTAIKEAESSEE